MKKILAALIAFSIALGMTSALNVEKASKQESSKKIYFMADPGDGVG
ncbi:TPA: hypothetical protein ROY11_004510 [Bacillus cereus]|nr:hypothetical protein [Bacillus cereus]